MNPGVVKILLILLLVLPPALCRAGELEDQIIRHEGVRLHPYVCPAGFLTIGVGRNLEAQGITPDEADFLLQNDIQDSLSDLRTIFENFDQFTPARQKALIDLRFNLGPDRFRTFKRMIAAVKAGDWNLAAAELKDSLWWTQVQEERRETLYRQILTGH